MNPKSKIKSTNEKGEEEISIEASFNNKLDSILMTVVSFLFLFYFPFDYAI